MAEFNDVVLVKKNATLSRLKNNIFKWPSPHRYSSADKHKKISLEFARAYVIRYRSDYRNGLKNCVYQIHGREFTDLNFAKGEILKTFEDSTRKDLFEVRQYPDGKKFIYHFYDIPTFDAEDRDWDGDGDVVVFRDNDGVNLISCRSGYYIPEIEIFVGLQTQDADFEKFLAELD